MVKNILMFISICASFGALSMLSSSLNQSGMPERMQKFQEQFLQDQEQEKLFCSIKIAMQENNRERLRDFVKKGVNLNIQNQFGRTPLMEAIAQIDWQILDILLELNINQQDNAGFTVLNFLEKAMTGPFERWLLDLLRERHKNFLEQGATKYPDVVQKHEEFWAFCSRFGNNGSIQKWIDKQKDGFNLDALSIDDKSALMCACYVNNKQIVSDLLRAGAILTVSQALTSYCTFSNLDLEMIVIFLSSKAVSQDCKDNVLVLLVKDGMKIPFYRYKENVVYLVIKELLKHGANPNARCSVQKTLVLQHAIYQFKFEIIELLLEHGADPFKVRVYNKDIALKARIEEAREQLVMNTFLQGLKAKELSFVCPIIQRIGDSLKTEATVPKPL